MSKHLPPLLLSLAVITPVPGWADDLFTEAADVPQVLTATRLKQSAAAVPGSMTVLDRSLIEASGARDIPELMRLVPGMMVGYNYAGYLSTINYHGGRQGDARRLQVLIDGRSVYRPGLATVDWSDLPLALEDVDRIEVFRGPNTVSFGANALMGVINIITRSPADSQGTRLKYTTGQRGIDDWYVRQGFNWSGGDARLSLSGMEDNGFDRTDTGMKYRDNRRNIRAQLSVAHTLNFQHSIDWQLAASEASDQRSTYSNEYLVKGVVSNVDKGKDVKSRDYAGSLTWTFDANSNHTLKFQTDLQRWERVQEWRGCDLSLSFTNEVGQLFALDPDKLDTVSRLLSKGYGYVIPSWVNGGFFTPAEAPLALAIYNKFIDPSGQYRSQVCGDFNQNITETRFDLEAQDTWSITDDLRLLSGVSYRRDRSNSETYFNGALGNDIWRLFGHMEWYMTKNLLLQGGLMYEKDGLSGSSLTPRVALNYLITPRHSFRFVYSEAVRSPDMFENNANWHYQLENLSAPIDGQNSAYYYAYGIGPGNLKQERTRSREIGYNGQFDFGLSLDIKIFNDDVRRMISEALKITEFIPSNDNQMWFRGAEGQLDWRLTSSDRLRFTYSYIDFEATAKTDRRLTARNSGSAGWMHDWGQGWSSGIFYYGADRLNERRFERADLRVAKRMSLGKTDLQLSGVLQQRLDDEALTWQENLYDERRVVYFSAEIEF